ncbi:MAG: hypothetical protein GXO58_07200 [Thermodesulfobacteria bacterium]|nr:hypothetical protein [Thermodesulfobacteriota bacterium]
MSKKFSSQLYKALDFVLRRQKEDGGFGATPKLPATLEDTYHALGIIGMIDTYCGLPEGLAPNTREHARFLKTFLGGKPELSTKGIYQSIWCLDALGLADEARNFAKERTPGLSCSSNIEAYYILRISRLVGREYVKCMPDKEQMKKAIAFKGILMRRWMYVYVSVFAALTFDSTDVAQWIKRCQNYDGGFGFLPGTTSFLENCHFALGALDLLGEAPWDTAGAIKFVTGCQRKSGGFSRKADAAPFLDSTYHGCSALILLDRA